MTRLSQAALHCREVPLLLFSVQTVTNTKVREKEVSAPTRLQCKRSLSTSLCDPSWRHKYIPKGCNPETLSDTKQQQTCGQNSQTDQSMSAIRWLNSSTFKYFYFSIQKGLFHQASTHHCFVQLYLHSY